VRFPLASGPAARWRPAHPARPAEQYKLTRARSKVKSEFGIFSGFAQGPARPLAGVRWPARLPARPASGPSGFRPLARPLARGEPGRWPAGVRPN